MCVQQPVKTLDIHISVALLIETIVSCVKVRHFEKWSRVRGMFGEHEDEENSETLAS